MDLTKLFTDEGADEEAQVPVDVSYDIIRHVSAQLYTSARKAIEELVCNSYDAGASQCHVKLPDVAADALVVLDNGRSMDLDGIRGLWEVARSPKDLGPGKLRDANGRLQIGKFGVGKLAAFALGRRLTYVTCINNSVRLISVNQDRIKGKPSGGAPTFPVHKLPLSKAKELLNEVLAELPKPWDRNWSKWTIAIIQEVDQQAAANALKIGMLRRMITTALPISAKFQVWLEEEEVPRRKIDPKSIAVTVPVLDLKFRRHLEGALKAYWADALDVEEKDVPKPKYTMTTKQVLDAENTSKKAQALQVPGLGSVIGSAVLTKTSLTTEKLSERGYSNNGFAVTCFNKLVNPEDPLFGITQRSHKYWSRFLARVEMPGLDNVLLVQRNAVSENSQEAQLAREVLRTLFNYVRSLAEEKDTEGEEYDPGSFGERLATSAPILAQAAIKGMLHSAVGPEDLKNLSIEFVTLGVDGPAARFDKESRKILINSDHPLPNSMDELGDLSKQMRRVLGEVLAGIELAKGYLRAREVDDAIIDDLDEVLDAALRSAAEFVRDAVEEHIQLIHDASFEGDTPFEKAVVEAFRSLRLAARHHGESDEPDGTIEIPLSGQANARVSIEAKGSKGIITHKELREATVKRHSKESGCKYAIAIAREFSTKGIGAKDSALLRETKQSVTLFTVEDIALMLRLHKRRNFTYSKVLTVLTTWKHPNERAAFIEEVWGEIPETGIVRLILTVAHDLVEQDDTNRPDPGMILGDARVRARKLKKEDIIRVLESVQLGTQMITIVDPRDHTFELNAPVDTILEALSADFDSSAKAAEQSKGPTRRVTP